MSRFSCWVSVPRPMFLTASISPVLVGFALGLAVTGVFSVWLFVLALLGIMALHSGANMANDYYDHISGNDLANNNVSPFSGGSRYIQEGLLDPKFFLISSLVFLAIGSVLGLVIALKTKSLFIFILGVIGLLGGFFYTATPIKLGYRAIGEPIIAFLFGIFPVYGCYYLQTRQLDLLPLLPGAIVGILVFLIILVNDFPDYQADASVNKKTFVVRFGITACIRIYHLALIASFLIAVAMILNQITFWAGLLYLFVLPLAIFAFKLTNEKELTTAGVFRANRITIILHLTGSLALTAGFVVGYLCHINTGT